MVPDRVYVCVGAIGEGQGERRSNLHGAQPEQIGDTTRADVSLCWHLTGPVDFAFIWIDCWKRGHQSEPEINRNAPLVAEKSTLNGLPAVTV